MLHQIRMLYKHCSTPKSHFHFARGAPFKLMQMLVLDSELIGVKMLTVSKIPFLEQTQSLPVFSSHFPAAVHVSTMDQDLDLQWPFGEQGMVWVVLANNQSVINCFYSKAQWSRDTLASCDCTAVATSAFNSLQMVLQMMKYKSEPFRWHSRLPLS